MTQKHDIVVCDDETDLREMLQEYLEKRGFDVRLAANGDELEARIADATPDLIVLDINMPGRDGLTMLRSLRATDDVAVVMLTASGETIDKIVGLEMGADDYLGKPVDLRELEARIKAVCVDVALALRCKRLRPWLRNASRLVSSFLIWMGQSF